MRDEKYIVYNGDTAKYRISIIHADFLQSRDYYEVELQYGLLGRSLVISKEAMTTDEDGNVFLMFDSTPMHGPVKAVCRYDVPDGDIAGGIRREIDIQWLCLVVQRGNPQVCCGGMFDAPVHEDGVEHVVYERVFRGDVGTLYLDLTANGEPLRDSDGEQLRVRKQDSELY